VGGDVDRVRVQRRRRAGELVMAMDAGRDEDE
jgi:hypothetical protein